MCLSDVANLYSPSPLRHPYSAKVGVVLRQRARRTARVAPLTIAVGQLVELSELLVNARASFTSAWWGAMTKSAETKRREMSARHQEESRHQLGGRTITCSRRALLVQQRSTSTALFVFSTDGKQPAYPISVAPYEAMGLFHMFIYKKASSDFTNSMDLLQRGPSQNIRFAAPALLWQESAERKRRRTNSRVKSGKTFI